MAPLRFSLPAILTLLLSFGALGLPVAAAANPFSACRDAHPDWYRCASDSDCAIIVTPCGWPNDAVARTAIEPAQRCNIEVGSALSCVPYEAGRDGTFRAACREGQCLAVLAGSPAPAPAVPAAPAPAMPASPARAAPAR